MALDTYIVQETGGEAYRVTRYKSLEMMEAMVVNSGQRQASVAVHKRLRLVDRYKQDGKPPLAVYWFEADGSVQASIVDRRDAV